MYFHDDFWKFSQKVEFVSAPNDVYPLSRHPRKTYISNNRTLVLSFIKTFLQKKTVEIKTPIHFWGNLKKSKNFHFLQFLRPLNQTHSRQTPMENQTYPQIALQWR